MQALTFWLIDFYEASLCPINAQGQKNKKIGMEVAARHYRSLDRYLYDLSLTL